METQKPSALTHRDFYKFALINFQYKLWQPACALHAKWKCLPTLRAAAGKHSENSLSGVLIRRGLWMDGKIAGWYRGARDLCQPVLCT